MGIVENVFAIVKDIWVIHPIRCTNNAKCCKIGSQISWSTWEADNAT